MQGKITQSFIQTLLATIDIVDVVSSRVTLKKTGKDFSGCCPFHTEKTPSFTVSQPKQFYHCFGCGAHGNAIDFLIHQDQLTFPDAIQFLADACGLTVEYDGKKPNEDHQPLHETMNIVSQYYQQSLKNTPTAIDYLKKRHLTGQIAKQFMIGYAPEEWDLNHLCAKNAHINTDTLIASGILTANPGKKPYARFRQRIMFPIRNRRGQLIGFGGRALGDGKPKYLNSPETPIFHKQYELYGLYEARQANKVLPYLLITEGYMDVIALHQHGMTTAVATLGTAINEHHIQNLIRYTRRLIFCFDGDQAGQKAAWKALQLCLPFLKEGIDVRFLTLKDQCDPDDMIHQVGKEAFAQLINNATTLSDKLFYVLKNKYALTTIAEKTQMANEAIKMIHQIPKGVYRSLMEKDLAQQLNIPMDSIKDLLSPQPQTPPPQPPPSPAHEPISLSKPAHMIAALITQHPKKRQLINIKDDIKTSTVDGAALLTALLSALDQHPATETAAQICALFEPTAFSPLIKQLAAFTLPFPEEGIDSELRGAIKRLGQMHQKSITDQLIEKAKQQALSANEKEQLQALLLKNDQDKLD